MASLHDGHRLRMYEKISKDALADHEWLEALLYIALPRRNTNDIAHELLRKFGTTENVLTASLEDLQTVPGVGCSLAAYIKCVGHFCQHFQAKESLEYVGTFDRKSFWSYVKQAYKDILFEVVDVYLLDGEGRVMKKEGFSIDSICTVRVLPEEVATFLLTEGASGVVLVHNHPFGSALPSEADDRMTKNFQMLCSMQNRLLCEHIIYSPSGLYSYYHSGRLREISKGYSMENVLGAKEEK